MNMLCYDIEKKLKKVSKQAKLSNIKFYSKTLKKKLVFVLFHGFGPNPGDVIKRFSPF